MRLALERLMPSCSAARGSVPVRKSARKKIERFSIHAADKGRQTMLVERLERLDGILSVLAFPTKNRFRH